MTPGGLFGFIGALYALGGVLALLVRTRNTPAGHTTPRAILLGVVAGVRHVWQRKELLMALLIAALYNITGFPFTTALMPIFARETLQSGPRGAGPCSTARWAWAPSSGRCLVTALAGDFRRQGWWLVWAVNGGWHLSMVLFAVVVLTLPGLLPFTWVLAIALAVKVWTGIGRAGSLVLVMTVL